MRSAQPTIGPAAASLDFPDEIIAASESMDIPPAAKLSRPTAPPTFGGATPPQANAPTRQAPAAPPQPARAAGAAPPIAPLPPPMPAPFEMEPATVEAHEEVEAEAHFDYQESEPEDDIIADFFGNDSGGHKGGN